MAQGLGSELFNLYSAADPLGSFRKGQMDVQKYDIQQANLDEQTKELNAERQQSLNGAKTGQPLQGMANQLLPGAKLYDDSGVLTVAGQMNEMLANSMKLAKQGQQMVRLAATVDDPVQQAQVMAEGRRMIQNAQQDSQKAQQLHQNTQNDAIYAAATAQNPQQWDNAIKAYQASGLPLPQGIPTEYSPENVKKIQALAPAALQSKINNDLLKREQDRRAEDRADRLARKEIAANRDGGTVAGKVYESVDEKLSDPKYGVAKGKIPAKEQTIARRVMADSSEVLIGVNQLAHLTESGTRDLTGSTFSEAKGDGFLKAPAKAFTNKISKDDSLMYDSIMYPIVKNMSLFDNPDYRPTDADVKQKMQAYKAGANEPRAVQVQKMAELKNTYMAKAESYLDAGILNENQAAALKKQMRGIEKAIPWNVNDAIDFSRQKQYKKFEDFLAKKGEIPAESNAPQSKPEAGKKPFEKGAEKPMPDATKLKAYADAHFGGDTKKATEYLSSQGYK
ncbi:hypothetical protein UFOVP146_27 [uncultured Caudovirales phage]|uniref:Uncharacterized protein n=1 Tax=uncultured Caudovirales phage TaxID=2100421 RepID=A0A6J7VND7_9CAUD|nr:hypothetical protein UFOVP146_27 [uncultured Caudovirales phage]